MSDSTIIVDDNENITYHGSWSFQSDPAFYQGGFHVSSGDADLSYWFYGSSALVRGSFTGDNEAESNAMYPSCMVDNQVMQFTPVVAQNGGQWICQWKSGKPPQTNHPHQLTVKTQGAYSDQQSFRVDYIRYTPLPGVLTASTLNNVYTQIQNTSAEHFTFSTGWEKPHDGPVQTSTTGSTVTYSFQGTSVTWWGACFDPQSIPSFNTATATYSIDGQLPTTFQIDEKSISGSNCTNERILFQALSLSPGLHTLSVTYLGNEDKISLSLNAIAYATATLSTSNTSASSLNAPSSTTSPDKIGIVLGSVVGVLAFLFLLIFIAIFLRRRKRLQRSSIVFNFNTPRRRVVPSIDLTAHQLTRSSSTYKSESISAPPAQRSSIFKSFSIQSFGYGSQQTAQVGSDYGSPVPSLQAPRYSFVLAPNRKGPEF